MFGEEKSEQYWIWDFFPIAHVFETNPEIFFFWYIQKLRSQTSSVEEPSPPSLIHMDYFDHTLFQGNIAKSLAFVNSSIYSEILDFDVSRSIKLDIFTFYILQLYWFLKCTWIKYSEFEFQIVRTWRLTCWGRAQPFCNIIMLLTSFGFWQELFKQNTKIHNFLSYIVFQNMKLEHK